MLHVEKHLNESGLRYVCIALFLRLCVSRVGAVNRAIQASFTFWWFASHNEKQKVDDLLAQRPALKAP